MLVRRKGEESRVEGMMTPMIDIVFQLLIFFMLSFKIVAMEGDFSIKAPDARPAAAEMPQDSLPLKLRLGADANGGLAQIELNGQPYRNWSELRGYLMRFARPDSDPVTAPSAWEVEVHTDEHLRYVHVVDALTAVSGFINEAGEIVPLVRNIHFAPRHSDP